MTKKTTSTCAEDAELLKQALTEIIGLVSRLALKSVVMESVVQELIGTTADAQRAHFANALRTRAEDLLQTHSDRLLPDDDATISLVVLNMIKAAEGKKPGNS